MRTLEVRPLAFGWSLSLGGLAEATVYRSGAAAEAAGRRLAGRLAAAGEAVKLMIRLKDGSLGGRLLFPPGLQGEVPEALAA